MARENRADGLISVVAPIFNEAEIIEKFFIEVRANLLTSGFHGKFEIVLVDDGSTDSSGEKIDLLAEEYPEEVVAIHLARNFGHQAAVSAGLEYCRGDAVILMDSDLQDDPAAFKPFVEQWLEGYDVVYARRTKRRESFLVRPFIWLFYKLFGWMANIKIPRNSGNFSLMDRRVIDRLNEIGERNRYLPGLRTWVGFKQTGVPVARRKRYDRRNRVGFRGLWTLAMNAIFSFSYVPIFFFRAIGVIAILISLITIIALLVLSASNAQAVSPLATTLITIAFFGGINLIGVSIVGEYVARIYDEVKGRPKYVIDRIFSARKSVPGGDE
ncbi:MAG TPA: glycosyltransferase family 2 protein [Acidobacteriota bacterium]|nr:glycosyltransferase family 2 protein [Acidobacteriota bacterium]